MKKIIIIDDHKMFAESLEIILEEKYNVVLVADSGEQVLNYLSVEGQSDVDVVLMDLEMPKMSGIELNKLIKAKYQKIKTIIVSTHNVFKKTEELIKHNANGYIIKNANRITLLYGVGEVLDGRSYFSPEIQEKYQKKIKEENQFDLILKGREKEVLKLIALELTTQEIADKLCLSKHTIETYRKSLMIKLNVKNMVGLTKWAIKLGLIPFPETVK